MMYRAFVFDFDYTLGDTTKSIAASINYALEKMGYPSSSVEEIRKTIGLSLNLAFRILTGEKEDEEKEDAFFHHFLVKADEVMTADAQLYPHAEALLRKLRNGGAKIAILSTKHRVRIEDIFRKFHLEDAVDIIIGNEDVTREKPDPDGLFILMERFGAAAQDMLYVGDSVVDAEAAKRAGVPFAAVLTGTTAWEQFEPYGPLVIAENLEQLDEAIKNL